MLNLSMNETTTISVEHLGATYEIPLTIVPLGYTYQLHLQIEDETLILEKDEEGEYRAIDPSFENGRANHSLVLSIIATLKSIQS